ncbi:MAG: DUF2207 domain-containing protein [Chloroflexaceae bacterium]|nr:DUF2207 domain-containing protein [Chloroflexaceae bacterium]
MRWHPTLMLWLAVLGLALPMTPPASAQTKAVILEQRHGIFTILPNGDVQCVETWQMHLSGGPFRQAFREISLERLAGVSGWELSEGDQRYRLGQGEPGTFHVDNTDHRSTITWVFAETSDATRTFELRYTLHGAIDLDPSGDWLRWTFIEADRNYPIEQAELLVILPDEFEPTSLVTRNTIDDAAGTPAEIVDGQTIRFRSGSLAPGRTWAIQAGFPHGSIERTNPLQTVAAGSDGPVAQVDSAYDWPLIVMSTSLMLAAILIVVLMRQHGRSKRWNEKRWSARRQ